MTAHNAKTKTKLPSTKATVTAPAATAPSKLGAPRAGTKQDAVLGLLLHSEGATIPAIMDATGWQAHSVRGFLAGVIRGSSAPVIAPKPARVRARTKTADVVSASQP